MADKWQWAFVFLVVLIVVMELFFNIYLEMLFSPIRGFLGFGTVSSGFLISPRKERKVIKARKLEN
ncbi:MAG: hypothetical protein ACTSYF_01045 [Promethearchaeota archaeon]